MPLLGGQGTLNGRAGGMSNFILAICLFVVVSRLPELMATIMGTSLKIALITLTLSAFAIFTSGRFVRTLTLSPARWILMFTVWLMASIPFSEWPGGSFQVLKNTWLISLLICFAAASVPAHIGHLKKVLGALAWCSLIMLFTQWKFSVFSVNRTTMSINSTLSNPNDLCMQLLVVAPCLLYWVRTQGFFSLRGLLGTAALGTICSVIVLQSGSRSGLIALLVVTVGTLGFLSMKARTLLLAGAIVGGMVMVPLIPNSTWSRYSTIFAETSNDVSANEASASATGRMQHLRESLWFTMQRPLFGVGPGQFIVASADLAKEKNTRALWLETHNSFTQVSSEMGIPGLVFYVAMIIGAFRMLSASRKMNAELRPLADAIYLMGLGLVVTTGFGNAAYMYYWPLFAGLSMSIYRVGLDMKHQANSVTRSGGFGPAPMMVPPTAWSPQVPAGVALAPRVPTYLRRR